MKNIRYTYIMSALFAIAIVLISCDDDDAVSHNAGAPMTIESFTPEHGGGGTEMLITGSNFSTDTSEIEVIINGKSLPVIGANASQIMVVVPKKCGSGNVTVKIGNDVVTSTDVYDYSFTRVVTTLAGSGEAGYANGQGTDAMFNFSGQSWYRGKGIAVDDDFNVYVTDAGNHCIRKIDKTGYVTTLCGDPNTEGSDDGKGKDAKFSLPYDLALDAVGNIYVVDPGNSATRKVTSDGTVTTVGKIEGWSIAVDKTTGNVYYTGCTAASSIYLLDDNMDEPDNIIVSDLYYPGGITFDSRGNLYVSVNGDHVIKKYTAGTWAESIIAGIPGVAGYLNGAGAIAKFDHPWGLTADANDNIYVAGNGTWDGGSYNKDQSIRLIEAGTYAVSTYAGSGSAGYADAIGEAAAFSAPIGVCVDKEGTVYVLDKINNRVRKIVSE